MPKLTIPREAQLFEPVEVEVDGEVYRLERLTARHAEALLKLFANRPKDAKGMPTDASLADGVETVSILLSVDKEVVWGWPPETLNRVADFLGEHALTRLGQTGPGKVDAEGKGPGEGPSDSPSSPAPSPGSSESTTSSTPTNET